jgi:ribonuclease P protein component
MILRVLKKAVQEELQEPKAAIIVSRKVGNAVVRNRVKRRLSELFRTHLRPSVVPGHYLFIARPSSARASFQQLKEDMAALAERVSMTPAIRPETGHVTPSDRPEK